MFSSFLLQSVLLSHWIFNGCMDFFQIILSLADEYSAVLDRIHSFLAGSGYYHSYRFHFFIKYLWKLGIPFGTTNHFPLTCFWQCSSLAILVSPSCRLPNDCTDYCNSFNFWIIIHIFNIYSLQCIHIIILIYSASFKKIFTTGTNPVINDHLIGYSQISVASTPWWSMTLVSISVCKEGNE